jgi:hypothetical protein
MMAPVGLAFQLLPSSGRVVSPVDNDDTDTNADDGKLDHDERKQLAHEPGYYTACRSISQI